MESVSLSAQLIPIVIPASSVTPVTNVQRDVYLTVTAGAVIPVLITSVYIQVNNFIFTEAPYPKFSAGLKKLVLRNFKNHVTYHIISYYKVFFTNYKTTKFIPVFFGPGLWTLSSLSN